MRYDAGFSETEVRHDRGSRYLPREVWTGQGGDRPVEAGDEAFEGEWLRAARLAAAHGSGGPGLLHVRAGDQLRLDRTVGAGPWRREGQQRLSRGLPADYSSHRGWTPRDSVGDRVALRHADPRSSPAARTAAGGCGDARAP